MVHTFPSRPLGMAFNIKGGFLEVKKLPPHAINLYRRENPRSRQTPPILLILWGRGNFDWVFYKRHCNLENPNRIFLQ
jgi:hypothetical protein